MVQCKQCDKIYISGQTTVLLEAGVGKEGVEDGWEIIHTNVVLKQETLLRKFLLATNPMFKTPPLYNTSFV